MTVPIAGVEGGCMQVRPPWIKHFSI